jgi:protein-L-isoaspartate O-methyltransferase
MAYRYQGYTNEGMVAALEEDQLFKAPEIKDALLRIKRGEFIPVENLEEAYFDRPMRTDLGLIYLPLICMLSVYKLWIYAQDRAF